MTRKRGAFIYQV